MIANKVFLDPRDVNCVFCYTDVAVPLDTVVTINDVTVRSAKSSHQLMDGTPVLVILTKAS